jgi:hypothetical protein
LKRGQQNAIRLAYTSLVEGNSTHRNLIVTPEMAYETVKIAETICNRV